MNEPYFLYNITHHRRETKIMHLEKQLTEHTSTFVIHFLKLKMAAAEATGRSRSVKWRNC